MHLPELEQVILLRRYKRFLADVELASGAVVTVHCPNTGAMTGCAQPGSQAWVSTSKNAARKYPRTLELVETREGIVSVNTGRANHLVREAIEAHVIPTLGHFSAIRPEAAIPGGGGRFDFALESALETVYVEVKSATLYLGNGTGAFPDAVSERALKHVRALQAVVADGFRGVLIFCAQHCAIDRVRPAREIYEPYALALVDAVRAGVEVLALGCRTNLQEFVVDRCIEFELR